MREERMFILNMLSDGKITADEAVNLLNALNTPESRSFDEFARGIKGKAAVFAEKAEPKVKKAAQGIKDVSVEVFGGIKEKMMEKKAQDDENGPTDAEYVEVVFEDADESEDEE